MTDCKNTYGPKNLDGSDEMNRDGCVPDPASLNPACKPWQLSKSPDAAIIDSYVAESMNIASSDANVFKLLGVHEQQKIVDASGFGDPISGGSIGAYPAANAFDLIDSTWKSVQRGKDAIVASAFIGYDFGLIKTNEGDRRRYSVDDARIYKHITAISLKQSANAAERVTKIRVERSQCGKKWKGVQVIEVPDDDCLNTFLLRDSVKSGYWRIRPLDFNGTDIDSWGVKGLQLIEDYLATNENNIQDKILLENRDREYSTDTLGIKLYYDIQETQTDLNRMGFIMTAETLFAAANFSSVVAVLGRPFIVGDIIEIPALAQFSPTMEPVKKYMEVIDTMWASEGYTPQWQPTLQRIILQPAFASRETQDVFGDLGNAREIDALGLLGGDNGQDKEYQDYTDVTEEIAVQAKVDVPERGADKSGIRKWEQEELDAAEAAGINPNSMLKVGQSSVSHFQAGDGMPPNSAPYTEGDSFPESPKDKDYHRLTFNDINDDLPTRLHRYSSVKGRWLFLETDYRSVNNSKEPVMEEFLNSPHKRSITEVTKF